MNHHDGGTWTAGAPEQARKPAPRKAARHAPCRSWQRLALDVHRCRDKREIHRDLVCIQRADHGGGTISFDGEVIRNDGVFVPADLHGLNG